ncbi:hypothetical protein EVAR_18452_1 [Eumeta japonica]|uniref:Uncharacterized protein n=1 Tax=Eumeta variegata TaxID=151549 RepID=A0A4C1UZI4_EUMVA|nr:hypothetical protein EVAR_18452_1 [Eumeta japonica]
MSVSPAIPIVFFFTYRTNIRSTAELSSPAALQSLIPFTERAERRTAPHTRCPDGFPLCSGNRRLLSRRRICRMCSSSASTSVIPLPESCPEECPLHLLQPHATVVIDKAGDESVFYKNCILKCTRTHLAYAIGNDMQMFTKDDSAFS